MIKVYYVPSDSLTREYRLIKQGLVNNPRIKLVDNEKKSDFVFLFYTVLWFKPHFSQVFPPGKTIFIDYHDRPRQVARINCLAYFKRSWTRPVNKGNYITKSPISWPSNFYPLTMAIMDEFIISKDMERDTMLSCTIRPYKRHPNRIRVLDLTRRMDIRGKKQIGELNKGTLHKFNSSDMREYFKLLKRSRIVVTCSPGKHEGDHRTWDAFANGALVFVDKMYTPMVHPLIDGKHCMFYEPSDSGLKELQEKISYFLENTAYAEAIAKEGFDFTMKYHRASNRIDEILERIL